MHVLVVGGTGFLGPHVVKHIVAAGHEVTVFHTGEHEADVPPDVRHVHSPSARTPVAAIPHALTELHPEVVLHMNPNGEQDALVVVDAFAGVARRIVAISSGDVYRAYGRIIGTEPGPPDPVPLREDSPLREKLYPYRRDLPRSQGDPERWIDDYDKILVERVVMGNGDLPGTILRLPQVYGPGDRQHRLFKYLERMDNHDPTIALDEGTANWRWQRGYVENVANAIALATMDERAAGRVYNVGEPHALTEQEWIKQIGQAAGWVGEVVIVPGKQLKSSYNTDQHMVYDTSALRGDLGYVELVPQDEALRRTIAWERAHGPENGDPK